MLKDRGEILVYIGYFDTPTQLEWGVRRRLHCETTDILSRENLEYLKYQIKKQNVGGKFGDDELISEVINEIQDLRGRRSSKKLIESVDKLLASLN